MQREKHSNEYRIFGPPGCGKTTYLTKEVCRVGEIIGPENILLSSFTKAAATELADRGLPVPPENIGTLHAHCYRAMNKPEIAEEHINEFNEEYPSLKLATRKVGIEDSALEQSYESDTDEVFQSYQIYRAKMIPMESWPTTVQMFHQKWTIWKAENGYVDYTDMIEQAVKYEMLPPVEARIGIFDECQDFTPLQLELIRIWGKNLEYFLLAGDDDQAIYEWTGASPDAFINPPIEEDRKRFLTQSYRVPRVVQELAEKWIKRVENREPKEYRPRDEEGTLRKLQANYKLPAPMVEDVVKQLEAGRKTMVLGSCSYMLQPIIARLRRDGIPFSNLFRTNRGDWNPLTPGSGISTKDRLKAFVEPTGPEFGGFKLWTPAELRMWTEMTKASNLFKRGAKKALKEMDPDIKTDAYLDFLIGNFKPEALDAAVKLDLDWLHENMNAQKKKSAEYPIEIIKKGGWEKFEEAENLTVGTIHSVKGGQADVVYLLPDLPLQAARGYTQNQRSRDAVIRQFYVGITRAKQELVLLQPFSPRLGVKVM